MQIKRLMGASAAAVSIAATGALAVPSLASAAATSITGTGSSLVAPLASEWASSYTLTQGNYALSYSPTSSGVGITDTETSSPTVNFGGSDMPLYGTSGAYGNYPNGVLQLPWALTATGVGYNLSGIKFPKGQSTLHLSGTVLAKIYTGKITVWNDPAIRALNPGVTIPGTTIAPYERSGSSGDSYAFESFLSKTDPTDWNYSPAGTWPVASVGTAVSGNSGIAGSVESINGAIGYIAVPYLFAAGSSGAMQVAGIQNAAGRFEYPNEGNIADAALSFSNPPAQGSSFGMVITYPGAQYKYAYPISTFTYAILPEGQSATVTSALQGLVDYAVSSTGQTAGVRLGFVPLYKSSFPVDYSLVTKKVKQVKWVTKKVHGKKKRVKKIVTVTKSSYKYAATINVDLSNIANYDRSQVAGL